MTTFTKFFRDDTGAVTIDWVALTAGILLLGIMAVYAIFNGGVADLVNRINAGLTGLVLAEFDEVGLTPACFDMLLASGGTLEAGSEVTSNDEIFITGMNGEPVGTGYFETTFTQSDGSTVTTTEFGDALSVGTTVRSGMYFTLPDGNGTVTQASVTET